MKKLLSAALVLVTIPFLIVAQKTDPSKAKRIDLTEQINELKSNPPKSNGLKRLEGDTGSLKIFAVVKDGSIVGWQVKDQKGKKLQIIETEAIPLTKSTGRSPALAPPSDAVSSKRSSPARPAPPTSKPPDETKEKLICIEGKQICFVIERKQ